MTKGMFPPIESRRIRVWDLPLRLFHWSLVAAIAIAFLSSEEGSPLSHWHFASGWVVAVLIAFRCVWGFVGGEHSRWFEFIRLSRLANHLGELVRLRTQPTLGHNPLGALSVLVLLALSAAVIWTGAALGEAGEEAHELLAWTLLGFIAVHILAVILMSLLTHDNLVRAMITGRKPADRYNDAHDAARPPWYGLFLSLLAASAAIWAILSYDPRAFEPRPVEESDETTAGGVRVEIFAEGGIHEREAEDDQDRR